VESADISPEIVLTPNGDIKDLQVLDVIEMEDGTTETTEDPATNEDGHANICTDIQFDEEKKLFTRMCFFFSLSHIFFPFILYTNFSVATSSSKYYLIDDSCKIEILNIRAHPRK